MSNDLFDHAMHERLKSEAPLAARMRPRTADSFPIIPQARFWMKFKTHPTCFPTSKKL
jgi:hypothetical protein